MYFTQRTLFRMDKCLRKKLEYNTIMEVTDTCGSYWLSKLENLSGAR